MPSPLPILVALLSQADPAPPPVPGPAAAPAGQVTPATEAPPLDNAVAFAAGAGYRLGDAADQVGPSLGFVFDAVIATTYARVEGAVELGLEVDLSFERYARTVDASRMIAPGVEEPFEGLRKLMHYDVALLQTVALERQRIRPWVGAGGGLDVGYFQTGERDLRPGEHTMVRPLIRAGGGLDVAVRAETSVGLRVDWARPLRPTSYLRTDGTRVTPFGDRLLARLTLRYRF